MKLKEVNFKETALYYNTQLRMMVGIDHIDRYRLDQLERIHERLSQVKDNEVVKGKMISREANGEKYYFIRQKQVESKIKDLQAVSV